MRNDLLAVWNYFRALAGVLAFVGVCGVAGMMEAEPASGDATGAAQEVGVSPINGKPRRLSASERQAASDLADHALLLTDELPEADRVEVALTIINAYSTPCAVEDAAGPCYWDGTTRGNGEGASYFTHADGTRIYW